jgi:protein SCO1/2
MRKYLGLFISIAIVAAVALILWNIQPFGAVQQGEAGTGMNSSQTQGEAAIGGKFTLVDANNTPVTEKILVGKFSLVYFGFTSCPAVCPTTLGTITNALDRVGSLSDNVQPLFITVDPDRDTPEVMRDYIGNFHPTFIALTGTTAQTEQAAAAFKVYAQAEEGKKDYNVNHSDFIYLMDRTGKYITHFTQEDSAEEISAALLRYIR